MVSVLGWRSSGLGLSSGHIVLSSRAKYTSEFNAGVTLQWTSIPSRMGYVPA